MNQLNQQNNQAMMFKSSYGSIGQNIISQSQNVYNFSENSKISENQIIKPMKRKLITRDQISVNEYNDTLHHKMIITNRPKTKDKNNTNLHTIYRNFDISTSYFQNTNNYSNTLNFNFDFDSNKQELLEKNSLIQLSSKNCPSLFSNQTDRINLYYNHLDPPRFPQTSEVEQRIRRKKNPFIIKIKGYPNNENKKMPNIIIVYSKKPEIYYNSNFSLAPQNNKVTWLQRQNKERKIQNSIDYNYSLKISKNLKMQQKNSNSVDPKPTEKITNIKKSCINERRKN